MTTLKSHKHVINLGLLATGIALVSSGFILQFNYHMENHGKIVTNDTFLGMDYYFWSIFHKELNLWNLITCTKHHENCCKLVG